MDVLVCPVWIIAISIHAPREGSDKIIPCGQCLECRLFLSTLPARGATLEALLFFLPLQISIHAPREGSDVSVCVLPKSFDISIHAPREGSDCL